MSDRLDRVRVHQGTGTVNYLGYLLYGLNGSYLVVGVHYTDQEGLRSYGPPYILGVNHSVTVHRKKCDLKSTLF